DALAAAHRVLADDPSVVGLLNRLLHPVQWLGEFAADVDVRGLGSDCVGGYGAAFNESVRRPAHQLPILERSRLGFIGVAAEIVRLAVPRLHERPLEPGRESSSSPAAKSGLFHDVDNVGGLHSERLLQRLVPTSLLPAGKTASIG